MKVLCLILRYFSFDLGKQLFIFIEIIRKNNSDKSSPDAIILNTLIEPPHGDDIDTKYFIYFDFHNLST